VRQHSSRAALGRPAKRKMSTLYWRLAEEREVEVGRSRVADLSSFTVCCKLIASLIVLVSHQ
jgi:hypothetical protein